MDQIFQKFHNFGNSGHTSPYYMHGLVMRYTTLRILGPSALVQGQLNADSLIQFHKKKFQAEIISAQKFGGDFLAFKIMELETTTAVASADVSLVKFCLLWYVSTYATNILYRYTCIINMLLYFCNAVCSILKCQKVCKSFLQQVISISIIF